MQPRSCQFARLPMPGNFHVTLLSSPGPSTHVAISHVCDRLPREPSDAMAGDSRHVGDDTPASCTPNRWARLGGVARQRSVGWKPAAAWQGFAFPLAWRGVTGSTASSLALAQGRPPE